MNASLGFFEVLLIVVASFYLLGWLSRFILPFLARAYMRPISKKFGFPIPDQKTTKTEKEGKITIKSEKDGPRNGNLDHIGEYTDYEEVKE